MAPIVPILRAASELLLSVLAPPRCVACDARVPLVTIFCAACASTLEPPPDEAPSLASFAYGGAIARAIVRFKYEDRPDLARPLADCLARALAGVESDIVCPVPLHPSRLASRGYNPAALVASRAARRLGARFAPRLLARTRDTPRQATLARADRATNVEKAFVCTRPDLARGARILVIDDVVTTGATLAACVSALAAAGAKSVTSAVIAATP